MTRSRILLTALALGVLGAAAWDGFSREARQMESAAAATSAPLSKKTEERRPSHTAPTADPLARLAELRSSNVGQGLSAEAQAECWQIIRRLTADQVQACLADIPVDDSGNHAAADGVRAMLYAHWAELDPKTAVAHLSKSLRDSGKLGGMLVPMQSALSVWMKHDREAALAWALTDEPDLTGKGFFKGFAIDMAAELWVRDDPAAALERAKKMDPQATRSVVDAMSRRASGSEEERKAFFTLLQGQGLLASSGRAVQMVARDWAVIHPAEALASEDHYGMDDAQYGGFRSVIYYAVAEKDPAVALDAMQGGDAGKMTPVMDSIYQRLEMSDPAKATDWLVKNQRADLLGNIIRKQTGKVIAQSLSQSSSTAGVPELAQKYAAWRTLSPQDAAQWAATLPASLRTQVEAAQKSH